MRKYLAILTAAVMWVIGCEAQSVGIGTSSPNGSAQLDISSSSRGLLIPRMTTASVGLISTPATGLMVYDTTRQQLLVNMGTPAAPDWESIAARSGWGLSGNAGTGGTARLGTTDDQPLEFITNNQISGLISGNNTIFGFQALQPPYTGQLNVAIGAQALQNGGQSTANIAIGNQALQLVTTGVQNIGIGPNTLGENTAGFDNTAVGISAMFNNTGGNFNTAIGAGALFSTTNSEYNTAIGFNSGQAFDNGYNNVFVGANNDVNGAGYFNVIAIGQAVVCTASSQARIGNSATNSIGGYANWTNFSDGRYKKNITAEGVKGLDFIMRLRPITYNLDVTGIRGHLGQKAPADAGTQRSIADREGEVLSGFAAQEVEAAAKASGYTFSGVDKPKNDKDFYGLRYGDFVVPLVKAVQEQQGQIASQQKMIELLQQEVAALKKQLQK